MYVMSKILKIVLQNDIDAVLDIVNTYNDIIQRTEGDRTIYLTLDDFVKSMIYRVVQVVYVIDEARKKKNLGRLAWESVRSADGYNYLDVFDPAFGGILLFDHSRDRWYCFRPDDRRYFSRSWGIDNIEILEKDGNK